MEKLDIECDLMVLFNEQALHQLNKKLIIYWINYEQIIANARLPLAHGYFAKYRRRLGGIG